MFYKPLSFFTKPVFKSFCLFWIFSQFSYLRVPISKLPAWIYYSSSTFYTVSDIWETPTFSRIFKQIWYLPKPVTKQNIYFKAVSVYWNKSLAWLYHQKLPYLQCKNPTYRRHWISQPKRIKAPKKNEENISGGVPLSKFGVPPGYPGYPQGTPGTPGVPPVETITKENPISGIFSGEGGVMYGHSFG